MIRTFIFILTVLCSINTLCSQTSNNNSGTNNNLRLSFEAGLGYRTITIGGEFSSKELEDHTKALRTGLNIDTHLSYFIKSHWGLGITYNLFRTKKETSFSSPFSGFEQTLKNDITIQYIAPELLYRLVSKNEKHGFIGTLSVGALRFKDSGGDVTSTSNSLGLGFGVMYDYYITPSIAIGVSSNYTIGTLNKISIEDEEFDFEESLSKVHLGGGIRFYF